MDEGDQRNLDFGLTFFSNTFSVSNWTISPACDMIGKNWRVVWVVKMQWLMIISLPVGCMMKCLLLSFAWNHFYSASLSWPDHSSHTLGIYRQKKVFRVDYHNTESKDSFVLLQSSSRGRCCILRLALEHCLCATKNV